MVIDTTGAPVVLGAAVDLVGHGGRVVVVGMTGATAPFGPAPLPIKELDVLGVNCCTYEEFAAAADLVRRTAADVAALVSHRVPLAETSPTSAAGAPGTRPSTLPGPRRCRSGGWATPRRCRGRRCCWPPTASVMTGAVYPVDGGALAGFS